MTKTGIAVHSRPTATPAMMLVAGPVSEASAIDFYLRHGFVPLGAPVLLTGMDNPAANGLWVAQDTGGAIRGPNRFDTFWGAGEEAADIAGGMSARGRAFLLLPRGTLGRIRADGPASQR